MKSTAKEHTAPPTPSAPLTLYNTETRSLEQFTPSSNHRPVRIYTCGPTVYDYAHIGNLRSFVMADLLKRTLLHNNHEVAHTTNLTDFGHLTGDNDEGEDKIMKAMKQQGVPITKDAMRSVTDTYIDAFKEDVAALRIMEPTTWSRASDYIFEQVQLIKTLDQKGYTYEIDDGVYFDISKFPKYGRLGNIDINTLKSGARVEVNTQKRHPADFAVWKKGLLGWNSPWGKGFPGWHIECSAMAITTLGRHVDIHTGGIDLTHTHHNAEIAQSEAATGKQFVGYWLHSEFVSIDNTKISKSLGNSITLRHLYKRGFTADDYRYWLLTAHYRTQINFTFEALTAAKQALYRLKRHMYEDYSQTESAPPDPATMTAFTAAINDDLDTPKAVALLWDTVHSPTLSPGSKRATIQHMDTVLQIGLSEQAASGARSIGVVSASDIPETVQQLLTEREAARNNRNWEAADQLREAINLHGYTVEDTADGPKLTATQ